MAGEVTWRKLWYYTNKYVYLYGKVAVIGRERHGVMKCADLWYRVELFPVRRLDSAN